MECEKLVGMKEDLEKLKKELMIDWFNFFNLLSVNIIKNKIPFKKKKIQETILFNTIHINIKIIKLIGGNNNFANCN